MIVVLGASHDDVLYFDRVLLNRKEELILNKFKASTGTIFNQEVLVISGLYSSALTSAVVTYILQKHYIDLVICVGRCFGLDKGVTTGDIVISSSIIDTNIDLTSISNVGLGEIPGFKREYKVQNDIITYLKKGIAKRTYVTSYNAYFLSTDNLSEEATRLIYQKKHVFGISDEKIVVDHNSSGAALAANIKDVPFVSIKVVQNSLNENTKVDDYLKVLERYIDLGKAVAATIGDIGRNDVLRGGQF